MAIAKLQIIVLVKSAGKGQFAMAAYLCQVANMETVHMLWNVIAWTDGLEDFANFLSAVIVIMESVKVLRNAFAFLVGMVQHVIDVRPYQDVRMEYAGIIPTPVNVMLVGLVTCVMNLIAMMDLAVIMELVLKTMVETFVFVNQGGKEVLVIDVFLIGNVHNPTTSTAFQPVSIQMTVSVQHPIYLIQKDSVAMLD